MSKRWSSRAADTRSGGAPAPPSYLDAANLRRAAVLAAVATASAVPRLAIAGRLEPTFLAATWTGMTLVAGAATAWSREAGLAGLAPRRGRGRVAVLAAAAGLAIGFIAAPLDARLAAMLDASGDPLAARLAVPRDTAGALALLVWGAGFETILFHAAAVALVARASGSKRVAVVVPAFLPAAIAAARLARRDPPAGLAAALVALHLARALVANLCFARGGLVGASLVAAAADARHLLRT